MVFNNNGRRLHERGYLEPYDTDRLLKVTLNTKELELNLLDTSPGGIGVLVRAGDKDILASMEVGSLIHAELGTPESLNKARFQIIHATKIGTGNFMGDYHVGLMHVTA